MAFQALVWRRSDFRESSRIVTVVTREHGRLRVLAKGAHRSTSQTLGKLDFLNRLEVTLAGRGMPVLGRVRLVHEPRALREPVRFLTACYAVELFDRALVEGRADADLFELCAGGLTLLEAAPRDRLRTVVAGIELRLLDVLGLLPALDACSECGAPLDARRDPTTGELGCGVYCARHAPPRAAPIPRSGLAWLAQLAATPASAWPELPPSPHTASGLGILARWIGASLDGVPRSRRDALDAGAKVAACNEDRGRLQ